MAPVIDNSLETLEDFEERISIPLTTTPGCSEQSAKNEIRKRKAKDKDTGKKTLKLNRTASEKPLWHRCRWCIGQFSISMIKEIKDKEKDT